MKRALKTRHYIRYCDDFVILNQSRAILEKLVEKIRCFLCERLLLELHQRKVTIRKLRQGTDFLGYVTLPYFRALRTRTKQRMLKRLSALAGSIKTKDEFAAALPVIQSYLGTLSHCKSEKLRKEIAKMFAKWNRG